MQYHKFVLDNIHIEFHNNWLGEEKVFVNGQLVSKLSSVFGTHHRFHILENGQQVRYVLTSKLTDMMQVSLDLRRNGKVIHEDVIVSYGGKAKKPVNKAKKEGLAKLNGYDLEEAIESFEHALEIDPDDPEIWFHKACAHSVMEEAEAGFLCLKKAVDNNLADVEEILNHEMLAYIRIQKAFEGFLDSNFTEFDSKLIN